MTASERILTGEHFMLGDHACAEGALAAGLDFFACYPITPSTEVAERLSHRMPKLGASFLQMEDELGSMAAIVGASVAGARAMTATSGPGFSLMMENVGLAAMMEAPCVVVDVMRGSPSTGLPTAVGQGDVMQVRWGSHGDYSIVAYCPNSPQECFDLTIKAFNTADHYRIPTFVMLDEVVGHMTERVVIPDAKEIPFSGRKRPSTPPTDGRFLPFQAAGDGVPPMAHAGEGYKLHFTGLTHDERGYPALTPEAHVALVRRLVDKVRLNAPAIVEHEELMLDDAEVVIVAFGCTSRSARRAVHLAREQGVRAGLLRPITLWPFPEERVRRQLRTRGLRRFVVAELNMGQMSREVERLTQLPVLRVNHPGGAMLRPEDILEAVLR
ncbi:MAG: 2-oxoglutarate synthase subunit alpha [Planctomycetes bacterium]|nr:2-oxoglutarate synthase subunit alpha [Planctomycetota bacterium]